MYACRVICTVNNSPLRIVAILHSEDNGHGIRQLEMSWKTVGDGVEDSGKQKTSGNLN